MKIIKQEIKSKTKTLQAQWTVSMAQDMQAEHGLDIESEIARVMQEEIDREMVNDIMRADCMLKGWTEAPFKIGDFTHDKISEMSAWVHIHATKDYRFFGNEVWFESKEDLTAFVLRWA